MMLVPTTFLDVKYTAIIFDIGGVILEGNAASYCSKIGCTKQEKDELVQITKSAAWGLWDAGFIKASDILEVFKKHIYISEFILQLLSLERCFQSETFEIIKLLKKNGYRLYILSNFSHECYDLFILKRLDFFGLFDGIVCSSKVGKTKPGTAIFQELLTTYRIQPSETLFVDDCSENIQVGELLGIKGILYIPNTLQMRLLEMGISLN